MSRLGVIRLTRENEAAALAFLSQYPINNAFLIWLIQRDRSPATRLAIFVCSQDACVVGVAYFGPQVVLAAKSDTEAVASFAHLAQGYRGERMIVASRATARSYWEAVRAWHVRPRVIRDIQPLLTVDRGNLRGDQSDVGVRCAQLSEVDEIAANSAQMIAGELEYDPRQFTPEYTANVRRMIERRLWWLGERDGNRFFYCHIGAQTDATLQLQGIWTPPKWRGRGLASAALAGVCSRLLTQTPTISLYVNDFNTPALRLYDRVGFTKIGELSTYLF
ncbi:MAG: GNAT family N-acetyltransferase [Candidatus Baltobacteraceae bacterium]